MAISSGDGSIILTTKIDDKGLSSGLSKLKSAVSALGKAFAGLGVAAAVGFGAIAKSAVDSYAEYEQLKGGVETLFKESSDTVMQYAERAYETAGLSANEYMTTVTSFSASLLQSLDGDTEKAAQYADQAIIDMSDNANKMGTSMEMIQNAYQGFAKQNYTMLDNLKLGYGGTKEEMQRLLDDAEKISGIEYDISSYGDIVQAIHVVQEEMGITGTTAAEASETIQGSAAAMKASWQNLLTGIADPSQDFNKLVNNFTKSVKTFGENLLPVFKNAINGIVTLVQSLLPEIPAMITAILPTIMEAIVGILQAVVIALPELINVLIEALPMVIELLIASFPTLIPLIITGIVSMLVTLMENAMEIIMPLIDALPMIIELLSEALMSNLPLIIQGLLTLVLELVAALPQIFASFITASANLFLGIWETWKGIFSGVGDFFAGVFGEAVKRIKSVFSKIKNFFSETWDAIKQIFNYAAQAVADSISGAVRGAINAVLSTAVKIINGFINAINVAIDIINAIPGVGISHLSTLSVPALAQGAVLPPNKPFLAIVGDQKHGTNIEAPLDTIKQAVSEVVNNSSGTGVIELTVLLDSDIIFKKVVQKNRDNTIRTGKNALAY